LSLSREYLGSSKCPACGSRLSTDEDDCPGCRQEQEQLRLQERSLGDFLVQNNLITSDRLDQLIAQSREQGQRLEIAAVDAGVVSARDLSRARFYLAQSAEIQDRLHDAVVEGQTSWFQSGLVRL